MLLLNFVFGTMTDIVGRLFIQWKDVIGKRKERCWNVIIFLQKLSVSAQQQQVRPIRKYACERKILF